MQLVVGSYSTETFTPSWNAELIRSDRGYAQRERRTLSVSGELLATTAAGMTAAIQAMMSAIIEDGTDVVINDDNGVRTAWCLINGETIDGIKVVGLPSFPDVRTIYPLTVPFTVAWQADYQVDFSSGPGQPNVLEFSESLSFQGNGGPLKGIELTPNGDPIEFTLAAKTPYAATQSGSITMRGPVSRIPVPLWPDKLVPLSSGRSESSPNVRNGVVESYSATWSYQFISATPLIGKPTQIL